MQRIPGSKAVDVAYQLELDGRRFVFALGKKETDFCWEVCDGRALLNLDPEDQRRIAREYYIRRGRDVRFVDIEQLDPKDLAHPLGPHEIASIGCFVVIVIVVVSVVLWFVL
jgi:hypothetical protein